MICRSISRSASTIKTDPIFTKTSSVSTLTSSTAPSLGSWKKNLTITSASLRKQSKWPYIGHKKTILIRLQSSIPDILTNMTSPNAQPALNLNSKVISATLSAASNRSAIGASGYPSKKNLRSRELWSAQTQSAAGKSRKSPSRYRPNHSSKF